MHRDFLAFAVKVEYAHLVVLQKHLEVIWCHLHGILCAGRRNSNETQSERAEAERYGVEVIDMRAWVAGRRPTLREPVYVSIDLDAFDPAFAPGVSHREPGGLTAREVLTVLHRVSVPLVGADIVEFNPAQDPSGMTATLCAKLVKEVAGRMT